METNGNFSIEKQGHLLYSKTNSFRRKVEQAQRVIDQALEVMERSYIAFSGGSDSLVVLHLLHEAGLLPRMTVRWVDDGWDHEETIQFLAETEQRYEIRLQRMRSLHNWQEWCTKMGRPELAHDPAAYDAWHNPRIWDGGWATHEEWLESLSGYSGTFMGLLASESQSRRLQLRCGTHALYQVQREGGRWHCCPLAAWSKQMVWAYIISRGLPYNPVYDRLAELCVPLDSRRVGPLTCFRVLHYGSHALLRRGWPERYHQLSAVFPAVSRYS